MRKDRLLVLVAAAMIVSSPASGRELEWAPTDLADTTIHVRTLFVSIGRTVFAGTNLGLLRTDNGGVEWQVVGPVNVDDFLEISPDLLVAVGREGIHRSDDGGLSWTQVRPKPVRDMCEDFLQYTYVVFAEGGLLLAGSIEEDVGSGTFCKINGHMYRSSDGLTWSTVPAYFYNSQAALPISRDTLVYGGVGGRNLVVLQHQQCKERLEEGHGSAWCYSSNAGC